MSASTQAKYTDLLTKPIFAHLATINEDGSPQVTPVWFHYDGTHIEVNSARGRRKDRNMKARPRVALSLIDPDNSYRYVEVRGEIVNITEDGADASIDMLSQKYLGKDYPFRQPGEVRVRYQIKPTHFAGMG